MRVTASKTGLLPHCQWWANGQAEWDTSTSGAADRGTRFHAAIAAYVGSGQLPLTLEEDIAELFASAKVWVDAYGRDLLQAEIAVGWDPKADRAELIGYDVGRAYGPWQERGLLCGSADIISVNTKLRAGYVGDWSTGDASRKGSQLRTLGLMVARLFELDSVTVEALEVDATGVRSVCREELDAFALAAEAGELAANLEAIPKAQPQPGAHCGDLYCPARATCPAVTERLADIIPAASLVQHRWGLAIASPDHAAWLYNQAKAVESAAKLVKDAVKAYVPAEGLQLEDGSMLAEGSRNMSRFDKDRAVSLLRACGATEEQIESCTRQVVESSGLRVSAAAKPKKRKAA